MTLLDVGVAAAGVDPRQLHAQLGVGKPDQIVALARAFEEAGDVARQAYLRAVRAHAGIATGFTNHAAPVLDAPDQDLRAFRALGRGGQDMDDTAALLKRAVVALEDAQASATAALRSMLAETLHAGRPAEAPVAEPGLPPRTPAALVELRQAAHDAVLAPDGSPPGVPGSSPTRREVDRAEFDRINAGIRQHLGPPDEVREIPNKGTIEIWDISATERIVYRSFSASGDRGMSAPETIDIHDVRGLEGVTKIHATN